MYFYPHLAVTFYTMVKTKHPTNPNSEWWCFNSSMSIITFLQKDIMWYLYAGRSVILHNNRKKSCTKGQMPKVKTTFTLLGAPLLWQWNVSCKCKSDFFFYGTQCKLIGNTIPISSWDICKNKKLNLFQPWHHHETSVKQKVKFITILTSSLDIERQNVKFITNLTSLLKICIKPRWKTLWIVE